MESVRVNGSLEVDRLDLERWHQEQHSLVEPPPPIEPPPPPGGGGGAPPVEISDWEKAGWPFVKSGKAVELLGRLANTRYHERVSDHGGDEAWIGQNNATFVQTPEDCWYGCVAEFEKFYETGMLGEDMQGGGEHFDTLQSCLKDRSDRDITAAGVKIEGAKYAENNKFEPIFWFRKGDRRGINQSLKTLSHELREGVWQPQAIGARHIANGVEVMIQLPGASYTTTVPDVGPPVDDPFKPAPNGQVFPIGMYFALLGHVDGHPQGKGVKIRNLRFRKW